MSEFVFYNGKFMPYSEAKIPLSDRALYFGDGCYEVMLYKGGCVYQIDEHFERLTTNCRRLFLPFTVDKRELLSIIHKLSDISCIPDAVLYIQVTRGGGKRNHETDPEGGANLLVTISEYRIPEKQTLKAITVEDRRHSMCNVKTLNLLCSVLALREANEAGCDCAILVKDGFVTEESRSNVFILRDGILMTRPLDSYVLPGIMRSNIISVAGVLGIPLCEKCFTSEDLLKADEVFISSTTKFLMRITEIDGIPCGGKNEHILNRIYGKLVSKFISATQ